MYGLTEQEDQGQLLGPFLTGQSHAWSYLGFPRTDVIQGKAKCKYCTALLPSWEAEASVREGFPSQNH